ncbi:MAG: NADH-quinone oxidoreductase subunit C [Euryarchaeota archaeon]|nr:NADH-quinone oxidoreductase subunit C [Euryarchaeota archaeon]
MASSEHYRYGKIRLGGESLNNSSANESHKVIRDIAVRMKNRGVRLVSITGRDCDEGNIELIYVFDEDGVILDHRFVVDVERELDSISDIYSGAINMERENIDLLGMKFKGLTPGLLLEPEKSVIAPLRKRQEEV